MFRFPSALFATLLVVFPMVSCAQTTSDSTTAADGSEVVARIGDETITADELEEISGAALLKLRQQMFDAKMQVLENRIFEILVERAAAEAGQDKDLWLQENLFNAVPEPDEAEIQKVMAQYRSRLDKDDAKARQQVVDYLKQTAGQKTEIALRTRLSEEAGVQILLSPPRVNPVVSEASPSRGADDAPVVLIEYTDFQCPYCVRVQETLEALHDRYGDSLRMVFKNLPLQMHQQAKFAAEVGLCAEEQDGFWPMHDWMFANSKNLVRESVVAQAEAQGLDVDALNACLDAGTYAKQVEEEMVEANGFGITGTPGFLVNGRVLTGAQPLENFVKVINEELRLAGQPIPEPPAEEAQAEEESNESGSLPRHPDEPEAAVD